MKRKFVWNTRTTDFLLLLFFRDSRAGNRRRRIPAVSRIKLKFTKHAQKNAPLLPSAHTLSRERKREDPGNEVATSMRISKLWDVIAHYHFSQVTPNQEVNTLSIVDIIWSNITVSYYERRILLGNKMIIRIILSVLTLFAVIQFSGRFPHFLINLRLVTANDIFRSEVFLYRWKLRCSRHFVLFNSLFDVDKVSCLHHSRLEWFNSCSTVGLQPDW